MIYVMSDIHGCYQKYMAMLEKIQFGTKDVLYILGDVVDRGKEGIKALLDIETRDNVILLRGNHDKQAGVLLANLHLLTKESEIKSLSEIYKLWLEDGGASTMREYLSLPDEDKLRVLDVIHKSLLFKEIEVNGVKYLLAHTVPEVDKMADYPDWTEEDYLLGEPDYEEVYFDDEIIITGHTPTGYIDKKSVGKIWKGNNHIAIDCGAVFGNPLGCLCLDTMEEFYV